MLVMKFLLAILETWYKSKFIILSSYNIYTIYQ